VSDARTEFFSSSAKTAPPSTRDDFFAGKYQPKTPEKSNVDYSKPYAYFTADAQRELGNDGSGTSPLEEVAPGFNQGVAHLLGLPVTALLNASNLASAGMGYVESKLTGSAPSHLFDPVDPASVPLTGAWNEQLLNSSPMGDVTSVRNPDSAVARVVHEAAAGVPGGLVGGGPLTPGVAAGAAGGAGSAIAGELGADPATQATVSLLSGAAGAAAADRVAAAPPPKAKPTAQELLNEKASGQSMGAAGAAVDLQKLSPDLKVAVEKAVQQTGGAVNPDVLARQIQADSLPVKVRLSEGQALADERLISLEQNARGKHDAYSKGFAEQNKALTENLRVLRDQTGPEVFSTNPVEHADTLIGRYQAIDDARNADIGAKYQALRDAAGGEFPIDTQALLTNVRGALKKGLATSKAPSDVMALLEEKAASGGMTLEDFEDIRTSLARTQRSASDGQERHAAGVIRRQIEDMPLQEGAQQLKGLADAARNAARDRFQALDADPAYKAAVEGTTPPDKFVQKFVIGGARDNVAKLSEAMSGDERAAQTLKVATLDHLRQAAGIDHGYNGNFTQAGFNKALQGLEPKLGSLLDAKTAEMVRTVGDVARYTQFQPKGSFVNNSNTFVAAAAEHAGDVLEGALNYKTGGIPVASYVRGAMKESKLKKAAEKTFAPGAGLTRLSDLTKIGKGGK
jgi:hypothetical protein